MKTILKSIAVTLLALLVTTGTASAKGGKGTKKAPPAAKPKTDPVEAYMKQHDKDKNGSIEKSEFSGGDFTKWDANKDGKLSRGEVASMLGKK